MSPVPLYKSLADESRLRILNLLQSGPLCVCHVQAALQLPQPKVSKQLAYLKKNGLLTSRRHNSSFSVFCANELSRSSKSAS